MAEKQLKICRGCLDTESKLYTLSKYNLEETFIHFLGVSMQNDLKIEPTLCVECTKRLMNCKKFRDKCLTAHNLLINLVNEHERLTVQNIRTINRINHKLTSNVANKSLNPNHYDLYLIENGAINDNDIFFQDTNNVNKKKDEECNILLSTKSREGTLNDDMKRNFQITENVNYVTNYVDIAVSNYAVNNVGVIDDIDFDDDVDDDEFLNGTIGACPSLQVFGGHHVVAIYDSDNETAISVEKKKIENFKNIDNENDKVNTIFNKQSVSLKVLDENSEEFSTNAGDQYPNSSSKTHTDKSNGNDPDINKDINFEALGNNVNNKVSLTDTSDDEKSDSVSQTDVQGQNEKDNDSNKRNIANICVVNLKRLDNKSHVVIATDEIDENINDPVHDEDEINSYMINTKSQKRSRNRKKFKQLKKKNISDEKVDVITVTKTSYQKGKNDGSIKNTRGKRNDYKETIKLRAKKLKVITNRKPKNKESRGIKLELFKVQILNFLTIMADIEQRKKSINYILSSHKCELCFKGFKNNYTYNRHMEKHTTKWGELECDYCKLHVRSRCRMIAHIRSSHSHKYSCTACPYVTKSHCHAINHERWHKGINFKCPHCTEEFSKASTYMSHLRLKHPSDFACSLCGYSFVSQKGIAWHMNLTHSSEKTENLEGPTCETCNIRFASDTAYQQHLKVSPKHTVEGARARNEPPPHSVRKYKNASLKDTRFECEECGIELKNFTAYSRHVKTDHFGKKKQPQQLMEKDVLCEQCGKVFTNPLHLKYHMSVSHADKFFECDKCMKKFALEIQLKLHSQTHNENRAVYECETCGKAFFHQANMKRHALVHSGKMYNCEYCNKQYFNPYDMRTHVLHVHMNKPWPKRNRDPKTNRSPRANSNRVIKDKGNPKDKSKRVISKKGHEDSEKVTDKIKDE